MENGLRIFFSSVLGILLGACVAFAWMRVWIMLFPGNLPAWIEMPELTFANFVWEVITFRPMRAGALWGAWIGGAVMAFRIMIETFDPKRQSSRRILKAAALGFLVGALAHFLIVYFVWGTGLILGGDISFLMSWDGRNDGGGINMMAFRAGGWGALIGCSAAGFSEAATALRDLRLRKEKKP